MALQLVNFQPLGFKNKHENFWLLKISNKNSNI